MGEEALWDTVLKSFYDDTSQQYKPAVLVAGERKGLMEIFLKV